MEVMLAAFYFRAWPASLRFTQSPVQHRRITNPLRSGRNSHPTSCAFSRSSSDQASRS